MGEAGEANAVPNISQLVVGLCNIFLFFSYNEEPRRSPINIL